MRKTATGLGFFMFFFLPWLGFILSLFNIKSRTGAFVYISFAILFGYAISFSDASADSYRYAQAFARFDNTLNYERIVALYRTGELRDLYRILLFYFTSLFSNNPKVMYALAGLVYGVFSYFNLRIFVQEKGKNWNIYTIVLAIVFFNYISLANINGFRFWTGAMVLFYATYNYIIKRKSIWAIGILLTPLFHYGFMLLMPVIILYRFIHPLLFNHSAVNRYLFYLFIATFFASWFLRTNSISLGFLSGTDALAGAVGERLDYINSDDITELVDSRKETSMFLGVQQYFLYAIKIYVFIIVMYLNRLTKHIKGNREVLTNLLAFVMFFYIFSFIANTFPSGSRFMNLAHLFFILVLVKFYNLTKTRKMRIRIMWAVPVFAFNIIFTNVMLPAIILTPEFWYGNVFWIIIDGWNFYI